MKYTTLKTRGQKLGGISMGYDDKEKPPKYKGIRIEDSFQKKELEKKPVKKDEK